MPGPLRPGASTRYSRYSLLACSALVSPYGLNYRIIADDGASTASLVTYLIPVTALILGAIVLRETPTVHAIVGMVTVLIGVALALRDLSSRVPAEIPSDGPQQSRS